MSKSKSLLLLTFHRHASPSRDNDKETEQRRGDYDSDRDEPLADMRAHEDKTGHNNKSKSIDDEHPAIRGEPRHKGLLGPGLKGDFGPRLVKASKINCDLYVRHFPGFPLDTVKKTFLATTQCANRRTLPHRRTPARKAAKEKDRENNQWNGKKPNQNNACIVHGQGWQQRTIFLMAVRDITEATRNAICLSLGFLTALLGNELDTILTKCGKHPDPDKLALTSPKAHAWVEASKTETIHLLLSGESSGVLHCWGIFLACKWS